VAVPRLPGKRGPERDGWTGWMKHEPGKPLAIYRDEHGVEYDLVELPSHEVTDAIAVDAVRAGRGPLATGPVGVRRQINPDH